METQVLGTRAPAVQAKSKQAKLKLCCMCRVQHGVTVAEWGTGARQLALRGHSKAGATEQDRRLRRGALQSQPEWVR